MKKTDSTLELGELILLLETKQTEEKALLIEEFKLTFKSLEPISLIKSAFSELTNVSDFKGNVMDSTLSLATGYLTKKIIFGATKNPFKLLLGTLLQVGVTSLVSKKAGGIVSFFTDMVDHSFGKKSS